MTTILIVDDYPVIQRTLSFTLEKHGYSVLVASDGLEALRILGTTPVDLAIVDIAMPEMDGITLLRHIRADTQLSPMPVIILTASGEDQDRITASLAGADSFINKPVGSQELLAMIAELLANQEG